MLKHDKIMYFIRITTNLERDELMKSPKVNKEFTDNDDKEIGNNHSYSTKSWISHDS